MFGGPNPMKSIDRNRYDKFFRGVKDKIEMSLIRIEDAINNIPNEDWLCIAYKGEIYKITRNKWREFLIDYIDDEDGSKGCTFDKYGILVSDKIIDVSDMSLDKAKILLENEIESKKNA